MHLFHITDASVLCARVELPPAEAAHALKVLRLTSGAAIRVTNGAGGLFDAVLKVDEDGRAFAELNAEMKNTEAPVSVTLYQGLPKADKLEWIVQKLTELGVARIVPVRMKRCVMRISDADAPKKTERLSRIASEAGKQSGRAADMIVSPPVDFSAAIEAFSRHELKLVPWEQAEGIRIKDTHADCPDAKDIAVFIGPEGGIEPSEAEALARTGARLLTLGPRILRTETAAIVSCTIVMNLWGDI